MCHGSSFDAFYVWTGKFSQGSDVYYFKGFTNSQLTYDKQKSEWKLTNYQNLQFYATSNDTIYPFGTRTWYIHNDTCQNKNYGSVQKVKLNFNVCDPNEEFNCADGTW